MSSEEMDYHMVVTLFSGYDNFKKSGTLYSNKAFTPKLCIDYYYNCNLDRSNIEDFTNSFIKEYIRNESKAEGVSNVEEIEGMRIMLDKMISIPEEKFNLYHLLLLHQALFSMTPHPEYAGKFRSCSVVLLDKSHEGFAPNFSIPDADKVSSSVAALYNDFEKVKKYGIAMKKNNDYSNVFDYIRDVVKINCELIRIQPFIDGNKRSTRCLTNKLFIIAGIPPVYISSKNENEKYREVLNKALSSDGKGDESFNDIVNFYLYKICDSIYELDIKKRIVKLDTDLQKEHIIRKKKSI